MRRILFRLLLLSFWLPAAWGLEAPEPPPGAWIELAELPAEARSTLDAIRRGGPHPYRRDGAVFHNREQRLPARTAGYYREYTVPTPGRRDRGPRRIVAGRQGEFFYTDDHYRSFRRVRE